jgi:hypothetical protein
MNANRNNTYKSRKLPAAAIMIAMIAAQCLGSQSLTVQEAGAAAAAAQAGAPAAPSVSAQAAFQRVWERTDLPVAQGTVARSWLWGDQPVVAASDSEPYAEGQEGTRSVQYYDKSRMEVNNPSTDPTSPWYVTNGLLVVEMMSGQVQVGDNAFRLSTPANVPVAGDSDDRTQTAPTYATLARVASLHGENRAVQAAPGKPITAVIDAYGSVSPTGGPANLAHDAAYVPQTGHNIPNVFWDFLNRKDIVYVGGQEHADLLMDWVYVMGYPITEPYWTTIRVGGTSRQVLVQAFQRRVLTFTPGNPAGWQVEMGNVGLHYYSWRYGTPITKLGQPTRNGYVLLEGKYVAPPYTVKLSSSGDVTLNGQVVKAMPDDPQPDNSSLANVPASPQTAADIVRYAEAKLRDMGEITGDKWQRLLATIRSLPATASVEESAGSIVVTDHSGGRFALMPESVGSQPVEQAIGQQSALAAHWLTLLNSGGVLFFSSQGSSEIQGPNATFFLSGVIEAFSRPQEQRLDGLTQLTGSASLAEVLLAAGPPSSGLSDRLSGQLRIHADSVDSAPSGATVGDMSRQVLGGGTMHTPKMVRAYLFSVLGTIHYPDDTASVIRALSDQTYDTVLYDRSTSTIDKFLETSGQAGVLYVFAHGGEGELCPEQFSFESGAKAAVQKYHNEGLNTVYEGANWSTSWVGSGALGHWLGISQYSVCIGASDIANHWKDAGTIIHLNSCSTYGLYGAFRSREYIAPENVCPTSSPATYNSAFWGRLEGTVSNGTKRRVQDAWQATFAGTIFKLNGYGFGDTDLSPAVSDHLPTGAVQPGQTVQGQVTFDTDIRTDFENPILMVRLSGPCAPPSGIPESASWAGDHVLNFSFKTSRPKANGGVSLTFTLKSDAIRSGDNIVPLDGNQIPANTDHVGPNHSMTGKDYNYNDDFVWSVPCGLGQAPGPGIPPTPVATVSPEATTPPTPPAAVPTDAGPIPTTVPPTDTPTSPTPTPTRRTATPIRPTATPIRPTATPTPRTTTPLSPTPTRPSGSYMDGFHLEAQVPEPQMSYY